MPEYGNKGCESACEITHMLIVLSVLISEMRREGQQYSQCRIWVVCLRVHPERQSNWPYVLPVILHRS